MVRRPPSSTPLSLHDALPISAGHVHVVPAGVHHADGLPIAAAGQGLAGVRSEEHTSELQSLTNLVCRLLLEKKKNKPSKPMHTRRKEAGGTNTEISERTLDSY